MSQFLIRSILLATVGISSVTGKVVAQMPPTLEQENVCTTSVWSRMKTHQLQPDDTLEAIATQYNLHPQTLIQMNPVLATLPLPVGSTVQIPPFNGRIVPFPSGSSWKDLETAYGVRADVLFEVNGCEPSPAQVFIPGLSWLTDSLAMAQGNYTGMTTTPLLEAGELGLGYGWHELENNLDTSRFFHGGIDLLAPLGTTVVAVEGGTVVFAGQQGNYGNLIVINHEGGRQSRYAHLEQITILIGQPVEAGETIGRVGMTGSPDLDSAHLHFEVRILSAMGWIAQDPLLHLPSQ